MHDIKVYSVLAATVACTWCCTNMGLDIIIGTEDIPRTVNAHKILPYKFEVILTVHRR